MLIINYHQSYLLEKKMTICIKCNLKYLRDKIFKSGCNLIMDIEIILFYIFRE